ncbi:MAG: M28 family peptidase [Oceanicoccus sp.]
MRIVLSLLVLTMMNSAFADTMLDTAKQLREDALQSTLAWDIVESLTTEVGPRLAGTAADKQAVAWAQAMLKDAGFDKVWLEPVEFPVWLRHHEKARVVAPFPQSLHITALGYSGSTDGELTAEIAAFDSLAELKSVSRESVEGKIVFINQFTDRNIDGTGYGKVVPVRYMGGKLAKEKGAVAVLIRSVGTDSHRFPHTGSSLRQDTPIPAAALSAPDADQLVRMLKRNTTITIALDINVETKAGGQSWNVIGQIDGREKPDEIILVSGHLDSWDLGTGAIDDGAGVAITTAAAQLIGALPQRPRRSVRVVLFANEEQGLWGGKAYAKAHQDELDQHIYASESDFGAGLIWQLNVADDAFLDLVMPLLSPLDVKRGVAASSGGPDIGALMEAGVSVFRLKQNGLDYFDYHHTADDTLDKINPESLKQNVAAWAVVTYLLAERK